MSYNINAIARTQNVAPSATSSGPAGRSRPVEQIDQQAVHVDTLPTTPPRDLYDAMAGASDAYDKLEAQGQHLHFALDHNGKLQVELQDVTGRTLSAVSPTDVLTLASGGSIG